MLVQGDTLNPPAGERVCDDREWSISRKTPKQNRGNSIRLGMPARPSRQMVVHSRPQEVRFVDCRLHLVKLSHRKRYILRYLLGLNHVSRAQGMQTWKKIAIVVVAWAASVLVYVEFFNAR